MPAEGDNRGTCPSRRTQRCRGYRGGVYRFLLSRRWVGLFAVAVALAVGCVLLGTWQWNRRDDRLARNDLVVQNYDREPVALTQVLEDGELPAGRTWTPVLVTGKYAESATVVVRNRPLDGRPGYQVLVPLTAEDGTTLLVDRGWVPTGQTGQAPGAIPSPPDGPVQVVARLRPAEPVSSRDAPAGQTLSIAPSALADPVAAASGGTVRAERVVTGAYGVLASETPPPPERLETFPRPALDEGPHLSYAMQWGVFALMALVGFVVLARRSAQWDAEDAAAAARPSGCPLEPVPPSRPARLRRARRRPTAEEEEDALVDAAERAARPPR